MINDLLHTQWLAICEKGSFANYRITLADPDSPFTRTRNVYEDLDQETPNSPRMALVILYPEHAKAHASHGVNDGQFVMTHEKAIRDMRKMVEKFGYRVVSIERDL
jgi:hypothetical protein